MAVKVPKLLQQDKPKESKSFADILGSAAGLDSAEESCVDIITFTEAEWGLGMGTAPNVPPLLPAQRVVLKCFYGVPLDTTEKYIPINDRFNENLLYLFTEQEFVDYLFEQGRINTLDFTKHFQTLELVCGRRGTKTTVTAVIAAYEIYKLLLHRHPQAYFGIMPDDIISMTCLSNRADNAKVLYDRTIGNIARSPFFKDYMLKAPNQTDAFFRSIRDKEDFSKGSKKYTIEFYADACSAKAGRGPSNILIALDEVAYFFKEEAGKGTSDKSDVSIYNAIKPSMAMFTNPDRTPAGKILLLSSPAEKNGLLFDEYERSFDPERGADILMIKLPSWEMNPLISPMFLKSEYNKGPTMYDCEYGSNFSDRLSGWIDDENIVKNCVDPGLLMKERSILRAPHFMGVDVALKGDGTAVVIVHVEEEVQDGNKVPVIVIDYAEVRYASKEKERVGDTTPYFTPDEIGKWIMSFTNKFHVVKGVLDQNYAMAFMPMFENAGIRVFEVRTVNEAVNSENYQNLMMKMMVKGIKFPGSGNLDANGKTVDSELVKELLSLQVQHKSKSMIKVFVPPGRGHDDLSDALVGAVKLASEYMEGGKGSSKIPAVSKGASLGGRSSQAAMLNRFDLKRPTNGMIYQSGRGLGYGSSMNGLQPTFFDPNKGRGRR